MEEINKKTDLFSILGTPQTQREAEEGKTVTFHKQEIGASGDPQMSTLTVFSHVGGGNIEQSMGVNIGLSRFWCLDVITATFLVLPSLRGCTVNRHNYPHLLQLCFSTGDYFCPAGKLWQCLGTLLIVAVAGWL